MSQTSGWSLVAMSGPLSGSSYPVTEQGIALGRGEDCEVVLPSQNVSRKHARVFVYEGLPYVQDLGSRNGVFVNGVRVQQQGLQSGDTVTMGEFAFQVNSGDQPKQAGGNRRALLIVGAGAAVVLIGAIVIFGGKRGGDTPPAAPQVVAPSTNSSMFANLNDPAKARPPAAAKPAAGGPASGGQEAAAPAAGPADQRNQMVKDLLDRAELFQAAGRLTEAREQYERALKLDATNQKALLRKERLDKEIAGLIQRHLDDGMKAFKALRYEEAISSWELVLNLSPDPNSPNNIQAVKFIADARAKLESQGRY